MSDLKQFTKRDFEKSLKEKGTFREMFQYVIDTVPAQYMDIAISPFFRQIAVQGIMKFLQMLNIQFDDK